MHHQDAMACLLLHGYRVSHDSGNLFAERNRGTHKYDVSINGDVKSFESPEAAAQCLDIAHFKAFLENASKIVDNWPDWKKSILGGKP